MTALEPRVPIPCESELTFAWWPLAGYLSARMPTSDDPQHSPDTPGAEEARATGSIFREEALAARDLHRRGSGDVLRLSRAWTRWAYWLLVGVVVAGLSYAVVGRVSEYAIGPAIVRVEGRSEVTATAAGTVIGVEVGPGQRVAANDLLVRLYDGEEEAEFERVDRQYEIELVAALRDPADRAARQELSSLTTQRALARARREERSIRAPRAGVVSDVRVHPGQHLQAGDVLVALRGDDTVWSVVAMLPGQYRPMLRVGSRLRLQMTGYLYAYRELTVDAVGDEVVGPGEVKRYLGQAGEAVPVEGGVVLVHARLPSSQFEAGGRAYPYYEGLLGSAEARVQTESILLTVVPGLRILAGGGP
jgi:biotin carboxyl carrier protein